MSNTPSTVLRYWDADELYNGALCSIGGTHRFAETYVSMCATELEERYPHLSWCGNEILGPIGSDCPDDEEINEICEEMWIKLCDGPRTFDGYASIKITAETVSSATAYMKSLGADDPQAALNEVFSRLTGVLIYDKKGHAFTDRFRSLTCFAEKDFVLSVQRTLAADMSDELAAFWWDEHEDDLFSTMTYYRQVALDRGVSEPFGSFGLVKTIKDFCEQKKLRPARFIYTDPDEAADCTDNIDFIALIPETQLEAAAKILLDHNLYRLDNETAEREEDARRDLDDAGITGVYFIQLTSELTTDADQDGEKFSEFAEKLVTDEEHVFELDD